MGREGVGAELRIIISSGAQSRVYFRGGGLLGAGGLALFVAAEDDADGVAEVEAAGGVAWATASPGSAGEPASTGPSREGAAGIAELTIAADPASPSASPEERSALLPSPIPTPAPSATHTSSALMTAFFPSRRGGSIA